MDPHDGGTSGLLILVAIRPQCRFANSEASGRERYVRDSIDVGKGIILVIVEGGADEDGLYRESEASVATPEEVKERFGPGILPW